LGVAKSRFFFFREFHGIRPPCPPRPAPELQSARARAQMAGAPAKVPDLAAVDWRFSARKKKKRKSNAGLPATFQRGKRVFAAHARVSTALRIFALGPSRWVLGEFWASTLTPPSPIQLVQPTTPLNARERAATAGFAGAWVHGTLMGQRMRRRCRSCGRRHIG